MFIRLTVSSLRTFVNRACWVPRGRSAKAAMVTAEFHRCFHIWNPSGVQVEMSSFGTRAISEEINWRFGPFVVAGLALAPGLASSGCGGVRLGGIPVTASPRLKKMKGSDQSLYTNNGRRARSPRKVELSY